MIRTTASRTLHPDAWKVAEDAFVGLVENSYLDAGVVKMVKGQIGIRREDEKLRRRIVEMEAGRAAVPPPDVLREIFAEVVDGYGTLCGYCRTLDPEEERCRDCDLLDTRLGGDWGERVLALKGRPSRHAK